MKRQYSHRWLLVVVAVLGLVAYRTRNKTDAPTPVQNTSTKRAVPRATKPESDPFTIADVKLQRPIDQILVSVVVPDGTTFEQLQEWHPEVLRRYSQRAKRFVINYYRGRFQMDADRLIASDSGSGLLWLAVGRF